MPREPFRARHRSASGELMVRFEVPVHYTLDQAATVLAQTTPTVPSRFGRRTAQVKLGEAAAAGYTGKAKDVDPRAVELYRSKLIETGIFPEDDGDD